jgi:hypothetical protein
MMCTVPDEGTMDWHVLYLLRWRKYTDVDQPQGVQIGHARRDRET